MFVSLFSAFDGIRLFACIQVAANQGRAVGKTIAGKPQEFVNVPVFWSARTLPRITYFTTDSVNRRSSVLRLRSKL
jgi:hypothetical protein